MKPATATPAQLDGWRDAKEYAAAKRWTLLATGDWSWVYEVPHTDTVWRITPFDPAFDVFVDVCLANPMNPHLPAVETSHAHARGGTTTVLERLVAVDRASAQEWFAALDAAATKSLAELRQIVTDEAVGSRVDLFMGLDRNPANVLRRPSDGEFVLTDAFWINGPLLFDLIRTAPHEALKHYRRAALTEWAHLPCMDGGATRLIIEAIGSAG